MTTIAPTHTHTPSLLLQHSAAVELQRVARGDSGRRLAKEIIDNKRKEEKRKKKAIEHSYKYDPRSHWAPPAGHVCHPDNKVTRSAIQVQKLFRGDSGRRLFEKEKKKAEKSKKKRRKSVGLQLGLNKQQKLELAYQDGYLQTNMDKASKEHAADLERSEKKKRRKSEQREQRSTRTAAGQFHSPEKGTHYRENDDENDGSDEGGEGSSPHSMDLEAGLTPAELRKMKEIERELKKHHVEINDDDDDETRAYKIKLNYLSDEKKREELGIKEGDLGSLSHKKGECGAVAEPKTNPAFDCASLCCFFSTIGAYYGFCVYLVILGGGHIIIAACLGIGVPGALIWLVSGWKKAKAENKRAIFLW